jgi:hypothetical protein
MRHLMKASAAAVVLLTGCGDSGGPIAPVAGFDAAGVSGNIEAVRQVLDDGAWQSLRALGPRFGAAGSAAALTGRLSASVGAAGGSNPTTTGVRIAKAILSGGTAHLVAPQIPPAIRGMTFVLDSSTLQYVPDPSRPGAPANGVRFILYAADSSTHQPLPGQEIGYADLTEEAPPASPAIALRLQAIIAGATRLDYRVAVAGTDSAGTLEAAGFTDDGTTRVEFRVGVQGARAADTTVAEVVFAIGIPSRGFLATATLQHVTLAGDSAGAIAMTVRQGFNQVGMAVHATPGEITGVFQVNGISFASVRGDSEHPTIQGADGRPLTGAESDALIGIQRLSGRVMEMFDCLMQPVGGILGVGVAG